MSSRGGYYAPGTPSPTPLHFTGVMMAEGVPGELRYDIPFPEWNGNSRWQSGCRKTAALQRLLKVDNISHTVDGDGACLGGGAGFFEADHQPVEDVCDSPHVLRVHVACKSVKNNGTLRNIIQHYTIRRLCK